MGRTCLPRQANLCMGCINISTTPPSNFQYLPKPLREKLADEFDFMVIEPVRFLNSSDKQTRKTLFKLHDGHFIEAVLMRYGDPANSPCPLLLSSHFREKWEETEGGPPHASAFPRKRVAPWAVSFAPQDKWASNVISPAARSSHKLCITLANCMRKDQLLPILC